MERTTSPRILSIQSHVVHGYVGNKSAVFPLQLLGFEVDFINSVQLCTHTSYRKVTGQILNDNDLAQLFEGLKENGLDFYDYLLTGYVGNPHFLQRILEVYKHLKQINPNIIFVCDPVMGDDGNLYVSEDLVPIYRNVLTTLTDILTPNHFELELLTNMKVETLTDAWNAIEQLHNRGCKTVIVSSSDLKTVGQLVALASSKIGIPKKITIEINKKPGNFVGTGDMFAALSLAWMHITNNNLKESMEKTMASMQAVLDKTLQYANGRSQPADLELKIVQSKKEIEEPVVQIFAKDHD